MSVAVDTFNIKKDTVYALRAPTRAAVKSEWYNSTVFYKLVCTYHNRFGEMFWLFQSVKGGFKECYSAQQFGETQRRLATPDELRQLRKLGCDV